MNPLISVLQDSTVFCECENNHCAISFAYEYPYYVPFQVYLHVMYNIILFQLDTLLVYYFF